MSNTENTTLTDADKERLSSLPFDLEKQYDDEIAPLIVQLHDRCTELGMPMVLGIVWKAEDGGDRTAFSAGSAVNFPGKRTPPTFRAAYPLVSEGFGKYAGLMDVLGTLLD